jgi:hypothetical protein
MTVDARCPWNDTSVVLERGRTYRFTATGEWADARNCCGIDAVENLVLADRWCNNDKRELLPPPPHVTTWALRSQRHGTVLATLATASRWDTDPAATMAVARSIYSHLHPDATPPKMDHGAGACAAPKLAARGTAHPVRDGRPPARSSRARHAASAHRELAAQRLADLLRAPPLRRPLGHELPQHRIGGDLALPWPGPPLGSQLLQ